jgi:hypothetical protein
MAQIRLEAHRKERAVSNIMNQAGVYQFRELEMKILEHADRQGVFRAGRSIEMTKDLIGHQIMDIILVCESLGVDFTDCLATAYMNLHQIPKKG